MTTRYFEEATDMAKAAGDGSSIGMGAQAWCPQLPLEKWHRTPRWAIWRHLIWGHVWRRQIHGPGLGGPGFVYATDGERARDVLARAYDDPVVAQQERAHHQRFKSEQWTGRK